MSRGGPGSELLAQAVDGMPRPMLVLDEGWHFSYVNSAGARLLDRRVETLVGRHAWTEFPEAAGGPFQELYERVRDTGLPGSIEAWFEPLGKWFQVDAFLTDAGVVVTYDDVTERRRHEQERAAAAAAREAAVAAAERSGRHLLLLTDVGHVLGTADDVEDGVERLASLVVPLLADWCVVSVLENGVRRDLGRAHRDPAMVSAMHRYADLRVASNRPNAPVPTALRENRPVVIPQLTDEHLAAMVSDDASRAALAPLAPAAVVVVPLVGRGELIGAITLVNGGRRGAHTDEELRTAELVSRRAALALDNARLAEANQRIAERMQRSLLSAPVQPDHLELAVRYRAATRGAVGGDWYDAFLQPDGATVLVIGDVMGHDVDAAAAMSQVRALVRGIGYDRLEDPAGLLGRVDHALVGLAVPALATALVCRVEQTAADEASGLRRLRYATAGHPEPMLAGRDGSVADLAAPVGPPLGIGWEGDRADGSAVLPPGSTLVLFTDGLFERRDRSLDEGREHVRALLSGAAGLPLAGLCDRLLDELVGPDAEDDVAILAVRVHPETGPRPTVAGPERVPADLPHRDG